MTQPNLLRRQHPGFTRETALLTKGYKLPKRNKYPYPETVENGYQTFEDELADRQFYIKRLREYLPMLVAQGLLSADEAREQFNDVSTALSSISIDPRKGRYFSFNIDDLAATGLEPYSDKVNVPEIEWRKIKIAADKQVKGLARQDYSTQVTRQRVENEYMPFLNAQQASGAITPEQKQQALGQINQALELGVSPQELPFVEELKRYQQEQQQLFKGFEQSNEVSGERQLFEKQAGLFQQQKNLNDVARVYNRAEEERAANALSFEQARARALDNLSPYTDWISRWQAEHTPNPYRMTPAEAQQRSLGALTS